MTEKITSRIEEQAQAEADRILQEAKESADAVVARAKKRAEDLLAKTEADEKAGLGEIERRHVSVAELDAKKDQLAAKIGVLDVAFEKAEAAFYTLDANAYRAIYKRTVLEAITTGNEGIAPAADETRLDESFVAGINAALLESGKNANVTLLGKRTDFSGGCAVCEGEMEMNFSTKSMMRQVRERIQGQVADLLFPEGEA
ncbi:hypothetical protein LJC20_05680 [Eubacteriales bacterium OttesenSCG-928-M02]|nr:hypothetical protein [Eubacteriales bacterium OttesenSCG-928-M02]